MQLMIEVLPAPFGPIIENSSPSSTLKLTSVSARTPPKRSDTPRTSKACSNNPSLERLRLHQIASYHASGTRPGLGELCSGRFCPDLPEPTTAIPFNILDY